MKKLKNIPGTFCVFCSLLIFLLNFTGNIYAQNMNYPVVDTYQEIYYDTLIEIPEGTPVVYC